MADKKKFLLRINERLFDSLEKWAADDLRSVNAQIEFILTDAAKKNNRISQTAKEKEGQTNQDTSTDH